MEMIRQTMRTPKSHEISLKVPENIQVNEPIEIIMLFKNKKESYHSKINDLKSAMHDELFLNDLKEVCDDFKDIDLEGWEK